MRPPDAPTAVLCVLLAALWVSSLTVAALPAQWLEIEHLHHGRLAYAVTRPIPFMYTLDNRWRAVPGTEIPADRADACAKELAGRKQHVATSVITDPASRWWMTFCGTPHQLTLTSRLRGHEASSVWDVSREDGVLVVRPHR